MSVPDCTNCEILQETVSKEKEKFTSQEMEYLDEIRQLKESLRKERATSDTLRDQLTAARNMQESTGTTETSQVSKKDDSGNGVVLQSLASIISSTRKPFNIFLIL